MKEKMEISDRKVLWRWWSYVMCGRQPAAGLILLTNKNLLDIKHVHSSVVITALGGDVIALMGVPSP